MKLFVTTSYVCGEEEEEKESRFNYTSSSKGAGQEVNPGSCAYESEEVKPPSPSSAENILIIFVEQFKAVDITSIVGRSTKNHQANL